MSYNDLHLCKECIIKCNCSEICPEVREHKILNSIINTGSCPDCKGKAIRVHEVTKIFWIINCCTCMSRFTLDFTLKTLIINRSRSPKGGIGIYKGRTLSFTTTTYSIFIEDMKRRGWGRFRTWDGGIIRHE
jgi:hypothetical protein